MACWVSRGACSAGLWQWNQTTSMLNPAKDQCLHELFSQQASRTPQAVALVCGSQAS